MIEYSVKSSKMFNYWTNDNTLNIKIEVYEFDEVIYSEDMIIDPGVIYFTELSYGWNDKKVIIYDKYTEEVVRFDIIGINKTLTDDQKSKFNKYVQYIINLNDRTDLCKIMDKNKSDKSNRGLSSMGHNYTKYYSTIFEEFRLKDIKLFELGLGTNNVNIEYNMGENGNPGASIFGWDEYFINGSIYGADVDTGCLFVTDKIRTFYCDQTDAWIIKQMWDNKYLDFQFDIIIEDGLHKFDANVNFFENSYHKLKKGGIFIIEDINCDEILNWINKFDEYQIKFPQFDFKIIQIECEYNRVDNNIIKITYNG
jgi:hypothetical protein